MVMQGRVLGGGEETSKDSQIQVQRCFLLMAAMLRQHSTDLKAGRSQRQ